jgi:hypothetical protein
MQIRLDADRCSINLSTTQFDSMHCHLGEQVKSPRHSATQHCSRSHDVVIRVCDHAGNVIETHEHKGEFKEW